MVDYTIARSPTGSDRSCARVCGITDGDTLSVVRTKLIDRLDRAAEELPDELAVSVRAALGIQPETERMLQLQDRVDWLARELRRDVRTARRRVDEACGRLAEVLAAGSPAPSPPHGPGWYVADFHAVALLDRADPVTIERREIVSDRDGLDEITLGFSLRDTGSPTELGMRVLYGGQLAQPEAASGSRMRVALRLPRPLQRAERHEYSVMITLPPTLAMQQHYAYTPVDPVRSVPPADAVRPRADAGADLASRPCVPPRPRRAGDGGRGTAPGLLRRPADQLRGPAARPRLRRPVGLTGRGQRPARNSGGCRVVAGPRR